jgi:hypothetical protein
MVDKITKILTQKMGDLGWFILKNQCYRMGVLPNDLEPDDIPTLAESIEEAVIYFMGPEISGKIKDEILKIGKEVK